MGRAAAELFAKEGAQVVAVGTNAQRLQSLRDLNNPAIAAIRGDVSSAEDWDQIVRFAPKPCASQHPGQQCRAFPGAPRRDGHHAGGMGPDYERRSQGLLAGDEGGDPRADPPGRRLHHQHFLHRRPDGRHLRWRQRHYAAAKGGVRILSKHAANEFGKQNIRVNSVHPGTTNTGGSGGNFSQEEVDGLS